MEITVNGEIYVKKSDVEPRKDGPWELGCEYHIRTVTMALHGRLVQITDQELVLADAAWIADSGRYFNFLNGEDPQEVEPIPDGREVIIGRGGLIDAVKRPGMFRSQK